MRNFQQNRGVNNVLHSRPVLLVLFILLLFFIWGVFSFIIKMETTRENRKIAENKLIELKKDKEKLSADIARLGTGDGVEESIREKFALVKEGEGVIVVIEDKSITTENLNTKKGFFAHILDWFR
jgi:cell division protein FtsB